VKSANTGGRGSTALAFDVSAAEQRAGYRRVDVAVSGSVDGWVVRDGPVPHLAQDAYSWVYDSPEIGLPQEHLLTVDPSRPYPLPIQPCDGNTSAPVRATARFEAADGSVMTLLLPEAWNGKLFVLQHGSGVYTPLAEAVEIGARGSGANLFSGAFLQLGFAVGALRRDAARPPLGKSIATLADGTQLRTTFVAHAGQALALVDLAQRLVGEQLGSPPRRTYWYGHSGGGITGHLINYAPGLNERDDGMRIVDAFLDDDAGNGLYLPLAFRDGRDVLLIDPVERSKFVPQIDLARTLYNPSSYLAAKRLNASILSDKGLGARHRLYEILGSSHFDQGQMRQLAPDQDASGAPDLSRLVEALAERLDAWVEGGLEPPASRTVALPEVQFPWTPGEYVAGAPGVMGTHFVPSGQAVVVGRAERKAAAERLGAEGFLPARGVDEYASS